MRPAGDDRVEVGRYELGAGRPSAPEAAAAWLRERGDGAVRFGAQDVLVQPLCGREADGQRSRECRVLLRRAVPRRAVLEVQP
ncbi:hypothetical protein [Kitasatospora sp. NPDC004272]